MVRGLLHQWHSTREVVFYDGPDLILDLQIARDLFRGQYHVKIWNVRTLEFSLSLLDGHELVNEPLCPLVGERLFPIVRFGAGEQTENPLVDLFQVYLILIVNRPETLCL